MSKNKRNSGSPHQIRGVARIRALPVRTGIAGRVLPNDCKPEADPTLSALSGRSMG